MSNKLTEHQLPTSGYVLGLDVGGKRIGAALTSVLARIPQPLPAIDADEKPYEEIMQIAQKEDVRLIVVGLPRNLSGEETAQSREIRQFAAGLAEITDTPIAFADESLSSVRAEDLSKHTEFKNASPDSLAACFILEEFFANMDKASPGEL